MPEMPKAAKTPQTRSAPAADAPHVAVVGAGLAGLTTALKLSERGFKVTLYEKEDTLGGNLSSEMINGVYHDVYPHMFCAWYSNFWSILEDDLGLTLDEQFDARSGVKLLEKGKDYHELKNATTLRAVLDNLNSGVLSAPEMFLLGFSMLDLASHAFNRTSHDQIDRLDVNGFIYSRGYSTESVAKLQNYILMVIWSIQSNMTAAASYQDFIKHTLAFPHDTPFAWLLRGNLYEKLILPLEAKLRDSQQCDCDIQTGKTVRSIEIIDGKPKIVVEDTNEGTKRKARPEDAPEFDYVVLAVPGPALANLVMTGAPGARIVDRLPHLAKLQSFQSVAIPVVDVYFNKKLRDIPKEQVGFADSGFDLTLLDISQLWTGDPNMKDRTALVLAASDGFALPSLDPLERGHMMIRKLHDYLPCFEPGDHWGDPKSDICWEMSHFRSNDANKLFVNDVGSWEWRPTAAYPETLANVFFAGDYCQTDVDMATVEAAVQSGLFAAQGVQAEDNKVTGKLRGDPVTTAKHEVYSDATFVAAKLALLPFAYGATAWAAALDLARGRKEPIAPDAYSPASYALMLPLAYTEDWLKTAYWLWRDLTSPAAKSGGPAAESADDVVSLRAQVLDALGDTLHAIARRQPSRGEASRGSNLSSAFSAFTHQLRRTVETAVGVADAARAERQGGAGHRRRARVKP